MNRKLLSSVIIILLALAALGGGTLAWFTDTDSTPTNTFVAGVLSMDVDDVFNYEDNTYDNFEPGDDVPKMVQVTNNGTKREFLRAYITEERTQILHFVGTELVEYLPVLDANGVSTGEPGIFAAKVVGGNYVVAYDDNGRPVIFDTTGFTAGEGYTGIYVTNLGGYAANEPTFMNGTVFSSLTTEYPVKKLSNTSVATSPLVNIEGFGVYRALPEGQWLVTTTHDRDMAQVEWDILTGTAWNAGHWSQDIDDDFWYYKQALYPEGYDGTPEDGNDNPAFLATVAPFLESVRFVAGDNDNIYQGSVYTIDVRFETIQVTNGASAAAWGAIFAPDLDLLANYDANIAGIWTFPAPAPVTP